MAVSVFTIYLSLFKPLKMNMLFKRSLESICFRWRKIPIPPPPHAVKKHREQWQQPANFKSFITSLLPWPSHLWSRSFLIFVPFGLVNIHFRAYVCENTAFFFPVILSDYWPHFPKLKYFYYCGETTKEPLDFQSTVNSLIGEERGTGRPKWTHSD